MKKRTAVISTCLAASLLLTGCSWSDVAAKFTGADTPNSLPPAQEQVVSGGDYVAEECVKLAEYKGIEVDCKVSDDEIEEKIQSDLKDHPIVNEIKDRACKLGDKVNIDYSGKVDKKKFDGGTASDQTITLGNSGYISGFDDGVVGMKPGEKKDLKLKFPDDYHEESLKGKDAVFSVTLNYISEEVVPELTDEFVTSNTEQKTVEEYRESIRQQLFEGKKESASQKVYSQVEKKSEITKYPDSLVNVYNEQLDFYYRNVVAPQYGGFSSFLQYNNNMTEDDYKGKLAEVAQYYAKTQLLTEAIAAKEGIKVTDEEIKGEIDKEVAASGMDEAAVRKEFEGYYGEVISLEEYYRITLIEEKVITFLGENAKIVE